MLLLGQADPPAVTNLIPVPPTYDGITTAIVVFILTAMAFPRIIHHRSQFYAAFFMTLGVLLLGTLRHMLYDSGGFQVIGGVFTGLLQIGALVLLFLSAGGLSVGQFVDEAREAIEVVRRGGEKKEVIVPLKGEQPRPRADAPAAAGGGESRRGPVDEPQRRVYTINDDMDASQNRVEGVPLPPPPPLAKPDPPKPPDKGPLPVE